jgi:Flp pilus assembly pilin Flp
MIRSNDTQLAAPVRVFPFFRKLAQDTRGAGFVEYIILVGLCIGLVVAWKTFGGQVQTALTTQGEAVTTNATITP